MSPTRPPADLIFLNPRALEAWYERRVLDAYDLEEAQIVALAFIRTVFEQPGLSARLPGALATPVRPA